jgi:hypothetical protein
MAWNSRKIPPEIEQLKSCPQITYLKVESVLKVYLFMNENICNKSMPVQVQN